MFNHLHVDRQGFSPGAIEHGADTALNPLSSAVYLPLFDRDCPGLDGMHTHQLAPVSFPFIDEAHSCSALPAS